MTLQDAIVAVAIMECSMQVGVAGRRGSLYTLHYREQHCWVVWMHYTHHSLMMLIVNTSLKVYMCTHSMITMASLLLLL